MYLCISIYEYICVYMYLCISIYMSISVYICLWSEIRLTPLQKMAAIHMSYLILTPEEEK